MIALDAVSVELGGARVLDEVSFSVAPGEYPLTDSAGEVVVGSSRIKIDAIVRGGRYAEAT